MKYSYLESWIKTYLRRICLVLGLSVSVSVNGEIVRDGSVGPNSTVQPVMDANNQIEISESMGARLGDNGSVLLHSFSDFSLSSGEQAQFTGNAGIQTLISRVTGANVSTIDGILSSSIPGAHMFFLNPHGIIFGPNAELDMAGDFTASTADTLLFSDGQTLSVYSGDRLPIIHSPIPQAFGFLSANTGDVRLDNAQLHSSGKINLNGDGIALENTSNIQSYDAVSVVANNIDIGAGSGIQVYTAIDRNVTGNLILTAKETLRIDGAGESSDLHTISQEGFTGGTIELSARHIQLKNGIHILSDNNSDGVSNAIVLTADERIDLSGINNEDKGVTLLTRTYNTQAAGNITLTAPIIEMANGADLLCLNPGGGNAGNISLSASQSLSLSGFDEYQEIMDQANIQTITSSAGNAGRIDIEVGTLNLNDGAKIQSGTESSGEGNIIAITATESINMSGRQPSSRSSSTITSMATGFGEAASGGDISITAPRINLNDGARISSNVVGDGDGGNIHITATERLRLSGRGGETPENAIEGDKNGARIEAQAADGATGDAGSVSIEADIIELSDGAIILTNAYSAEGGDINIQSNRIISRDSDIKTSVRSASGNGGDVIIEADLLVLSDSDIKAQALAGNGGNIDLRNVEHFFASANSVIDATSTQGVDGQVTSPPNLRTKIATEALVTQYLEDSTLLKPNCADFTNDSQLKVSSQRSAAASPEGLLPSMMPFADPIEPAQTSESKSDSILKSEVLRGRAQRLQARGDYDQSTKILGDSLALARQREDSFAIAANLGDLGNALLALGKQGSAEKILQEAIKIARITTDMRLMARLYNNLGNYYSVQGDFVKAQFSYEQSIQASAEIAIDESDIRLETSKAYAYLARVQFRRQQIKQALEYLSSADKNMSAIEVPEASSILIHMAKTLSLIAANNQQYAYRALLQAYTYLQQAKSLSSKANDLRLLSYALGNLGSLYQLEGRLNEALLLTRRALRKAEVAQAPDSIYRWHWQEAQLLRKQGQLKQAIDAYHRSISIIEASQQATLVRYDSVDNYFQELVAPVYLELVDTLFELHTETTDQSTEQQLLLQARATVERLKSAELKNYFRDECVLKFAAEQQSLESISEATAVVYPIVLPGRLELLLSLSDQAVSGQKKLHRYSVPIDRVELTQRVRHFRQQLENVSKPSRYLPDSEWLYRHLIAPYQNALYKNPIDTIVFVPTGPLRMLPLAALHDGKDFIIRNFAVATTLGLSLTNPEPLAIRKNHILLSGVSEAINGFPALDSVPGELNSIKQLIGGDVLLNRDFTVANFEEKVRDNAYSIIHIASHAQFTNQAGGSFLQAYDKPMYMDDLNLALSTTKYRDQALELLVLSACETAISDERSALGLAGAGIKAGARSALGSLWSIGDESTAELIENFYRQLNHNKVSKAQALRIAQLSLLDNKQFAHPFHWSAFLLIDNWL
jgi:filamentous hemagglutinin family protein